MFFVCNKIITRTRIIIKCYKILVDSGMKPVVGQWWKKVILLHNILQKSRYFCVQSVFQPKCLQFAIRIFAQIQRIAASNALICLAVLVHVWRRNRAPSVLGGQQYYFAFTYAQENSNTTTARVRVTRTYSYL